MTEPPAERGGAESSERRVSRLRSVPTLIDLFFRLRRPAYCASLRRRRLLTFSLALLLASENPAHEKTQGEKSPLKVYHHQFRRFICLRAKRRGSEGWCPDLPRSASRGDAAVSRCRENFFFRPAKPSGQRHDGWSERLRHPTPKDGRAERAIQIHQRGGRLQAAADATRGGQGHEQDRGKRHRLFSVSERTRVDDVTHALRGVID